MVCGGVTLTHDEHGYPVMSSECQETCVRRLLDKILDHTDEIIQFEGEELDDADVVMLACPSSFALFVLAGGCGSTILRLSRMIPTMHYN